jgi:hypothetical protein
MDDQLIKLLQDAEKFVNTTLETGDAKPLPLIYKDWSDTARETIAQLISYLYLVTAEVPCVNCDGNGFILGVTDGPDNKKDRPCKMCNGTGKKYNI